MPTEPNARKSAAKTVAQTFETIEVARSGARQVGGLFDRLFGFGMKPAESDTPRSMIVNPKQSRAIVGELISDVFGAMWCALWRRGR